MNDDAVDGWLKKSDSELARAQNCASVLDADGACYNSQQSIENTLKAALVFENINPPHVHDLEALYNLLPSDWSVKNAPHDLERISEWNIAARATRRKVMTMTMTRRMTMTRLTVCPPHKIFAAR